MDKELFGLTDLTPLSSLASSRHGSPQPEPATTTDLEARLKSALDEELFGLTDLTPLSSPVSSLHGSPEPEPATATPLSLDRAGNSSPPLPRKGAAKKKRRRANRRLQRDEERLQPVANIEECGHGHTRYVKPAVPLQARTKIRESRVTSSGYTGLDDGIRMHTAPELEKLLGGEYGRKFTLQRWDGLYVSLQDLHHAKQPFNVNYSRLPIPITDAEGRTFALCAGMSKDASWADDMAEGVEALEAARRDCDLTPEQSKHRRGDYMCLRTGVSIGGGQRRPIAADNSNANNRVLDRLNKTRFFARLASFSTCKLHI
jgi:hypothetical protein